MDAFSSIIVRLRGPILLAVAVVTILLGINIENLSQDEDVLRFLPAQDPDILLFRQVSEDFGGLDVAIVGVESKRLLSRDGMDAVRRMTKAAGGVDGVYHVLSFTELPHLEATEMEFLINELVPTEIPNDPEQLAEIRETVLNDHLVAGRLVSRDGHAAMILCFLETGAPQQTVALAIQDAVRRESGHMQLYFGGLPFIQAHVGGGTRKDIVALTPYVLILAAFATFLFFRKPLGALLVLSAVGLGTVWTIGGMAAMDAPMTVVSTSLPMVLVAIGGAYGAHVLAAFYVATGDSAEERVTQALKEVGPPIVASMLTTVAGFASFLAMDVAPMRAFGFQASVGVFLCALLSLVVVPAVLSFSKAKPHKKPPAQKLAGPVTALALAARRKRPVAIGLVIALGALAMVTAVHVAPDTSIQSFFRPGSEPAEADRFLRERFGGSVFVQAYMRGDLANPVVLEHLRSIVEEARTIEGVSDVNSFLETLELLAAGLGGIPRVPSTRERVAALTPFMAGNPGLRQLVDDDLSRAMVQITVGTQDTRTVGRVVDNLRQLIAEKVPRSIDVVDIRQSTAAATKAREHRLEMMAERVVRITAATTPVPDRAQAAGKVLKSLRERFGDWTLEPGEDMTAEARSAMKAYFTSDDNPFDPIDGRPVGTKLASLLQRPLTEEPVTKMLSGALPAEQAQDTEGVELAVPAVADRLGLARAQVIGQRLAPRLLRAMGAEDAPPQTREAVAQALGELDDPFVGVPATDSDLTIEAGITGTPVINRAFGRSTQRNQIRSLVISFVSLAFLAIAMFRSFRFGIIAVLPAGVTLLITFGIMGWLSIPLDPGTCMVAALALGIGIDYAIHFVWRRRWRGLSLRETARVVGPAISFNAVQVASGFAVMIAADTVPLSKFGILVTIAMVVAAALTFTLLPALDKENPGPEPSKG